MQLHGRKFRQRSRRAVEWSLTVADTSLPLPPCRHHALRLLRAYVSSLRALVRSLRTSQWSTSSVIRSNSCRSTPRLLRGSGTSTLAVSLYLYSHAETQMQSFSVFVGLVLIAELRSVEVLVQQRLTEEGLDESEKATLAKIQEVLYSTAEGFELPENAEEELIEENEEETF